VLHYGQTQKDEFIVNILKSLNELFCIKYTTAGAKKRRHLLYAAVAMITEHVDKSVEIVSATNKEIVETVTNNIHTIYRDIKKNEETPATEYLFMGLKQDKHKNMVESMRKMEMMNNMVAKEIWTPAETLRAEAGENAALATQTNNTQLLDGSSGGNNDDIFTS
jgi:hypothetical protein